MNPLPGHLRSLQALLVAATVGCGDGGETLLRPEAIPGPGDHTRTLISGGRERTYHVHVPPGVDTRDPAPVVLVFRGVPRTEGGMPVLTGFDGPADDEGLVAVYPEAAPFIGDWSAGCDVCSRANREGVDDVRFVRDLLEQLGREMSLDADRIYAVGYSWGGVFTFRLACALSGRISGFATVGALMLERQRDRCEPSRPLPALLIQGTEDPQFPWKGHVSDLETRLGARETLSFWLEADGCSSDPDVQPLPDTADDGTTVTLESYAPCRSGSEVAFYVVHGGGHPWPGAPVRFSEGLGPKSEDLDASAAIAGFLAGL